LNNNKIKIGGFGSADDLSDSQIILCPSLILPPTHHFVTRLITTYHFVTRTFRSPEIQTHAQKITKPWQKIQSVTSKTDIW
jgi:hypothetical protein